MELPDLESIGGSATAGLSAAGSSAASSAAGSAKASSAAPFTSESSAAGSSLAGAQDLRRRREFGRYSPFRLGLTAAVGFGLAYLLFKAFERGYDSIVLVALSLFLAAGLDPAVRRLESMGLPRGLSVAAVFLGGIGFLVAIGFAVVPPLVNQTADFVQKLPGYVTQLQNNHRIAQLDSRFGVLSTVQSYLKDSSNPSNLAGKLLTVGTTIADSVVSLFSLAVLTLYFLAYLRDITGFFYRLSGASRRTRVSAMGDRIVQQIGQYVAGTTALSLLAGTATSLFLWAVRAPYPFALGLVVSVLTLAPLFGYALAAVSVSTVELLQSIPTGVATVVFFLVYAFVQRWLLTPQLLHESVRISPAAALIGALTGYTTLGFIGFLVSIPLVAVLTLLARDVLIPRQAAR